MLEQEGQIAIRVKRLKNIEKEGELIKYDVWLLLGSVCTMSLYTKLSKYYILSGAFVSGATLKNNVTGEKRV